MIAAARVGKGPAADATQRMENALNLPPTSLAKIFGVAAVNSSAAGSTTRRIEPVHQPIEAISQGWICGKLHGFARIYQIRSRRNGNEPPHGGAATQT
jgi:hypothetical protein